MLYGVYKTCFKWKIPLLFVRLLSILYRGLQVGTHQDMQIEQFAGHSQQGHCRNIKRPVYGAAVLILDQQAIFSVGYGTNFTNTLQLSPRVFKGFVWQQCIGILSAITVSVRSDHRRYCGQYRVHRCCLRQFNVTG